MIAREIELEHRFTSMCARMVKEVASDAFDDAGDGTSTDTVLPPAI